MANELHTLSLLPTGTITEIDPSTGLPIKKVYQRVHKEFGNIQTPGARGLQRRAHVIPADPRTAAQLTQRSKLATAVVAWQALSDVVKDQWRKKAERTGLTGYQYFVGQDIKGLT